MTTTKTIPAGAFTIPDSFALNEFIREQQPDLQQCLKFVEDRGVEMKPAVVEQVRGSRDDALPVGSVRSRPDSGPDESRPSLNPQNRSVLDCPTNKANRAALHRTELNDADRRMLSCLLDVPSDSRPSIQTPTLLILTARQTVWRLMYRAAMNLLNDADGVCQRACR